MNKKASNMPQVVQDLIEFAKDSQRFLQKCEKPDKKGIHSHVIAISWLFRVYKDRIGLRDRIRRHGSHRIRDQARVYPH